MTQEEKMDHITEQMASVKSEEYSNNDRYADFIHVFRSDDRGLRVLYQILRWGGVYGSTIPNSKPVDVNQVLINEGERRLAMRILATLNTEPIQKTMPSRANHKES